MADVPGNVIIGGVAFTVEPDTWYQISGRLIWRVPVLRTRRLSRIRGAYRRRSLRRSRRG